MHGVETGRIFFGKNRLAVWDGSGIGPAGPIRLFRTYRAWHRCKRFLEN